MSSDRLRLLVLASTYPRWAGDPEPGFVHELSRRLSHDFEVHVLCPHAAGALTEEELDGVEVHRFRYAPGKLESLVHSGGILNNLRHYPWKWLLLPLFFSGLTIKIWHLCRLLQPDCIHAHWMIPQGVALLLVRIFQKQRPPFLITSHGSDLYSLRGKFLEKLKSVVIRQATAVTVVSRAMVVEVVRLGADANRVHVIPMGVDFEGRFIPGPDELRRPGEILFVGRFVEKKGLKYLIHAMPLVLERVPHARLKIAGFGPEETKLKKLSADLEIDDRTDFLGAKHQADLPRLYQRASVLVAPFVEAADGDREGFGLVTVEAIACGCPVIAGKLDVLWDIFGEEGSGMLVDPKNRNLLSGRIIEVLQLPALALSRADALRQQCANRLDWHNVSMSYSALLRNLMP